MTERGREPVLDNLIDKFHSKRQARQLLRNPITRAGQLCVLENWTNNKAVTQDFSQEMIEKVGGDMMAEVIAVASNPNPLMANRQKLAGFVSQCAQFQVLVIEPPPSDDNTGIRGRYGVSGRLRERLLEIAEKNKEIRKFMHGMPAINNWDDVWNPILFRYRVSWAWAHVFHLLRAELNDFNKQRDWFHPFFMCMCGWQEHLIRESIDLPTLIGNDNFNANLKALILSSFFNRVMKVKTRRDLKISFPSSALPSL